MGKKYEEDYNYEEDSLKKGSIPKLKNYYTLGALLLLFIISFLLFFYVPGEDITIANNETFITCGDGTFSYECSLNRPYYCDGGELIYENFLCGCPESLKKDGEVCDSKYFREKEIKELKYFLGGEEKIMNFTVYKDVSEYLDTKERTIVYSKGELPRRSDFKLSKIDDNIQREALMGLVVKIQNAAPDSLVDQARIATSLVQNIPYKESEFGTVGNFKTTKIRLARYPYQVIERSMGSCEGKSELLVLLLREIGYGTAVFYYNAENHETVGIKCPVERSLLNSGYCFIETTVPAPIAYSTGSYLIGEDSKGGLGIPKVVVLNKGISLPDDMIEYEDVKKIEKLLDKTSTNIADRIQLNPIYKKYGMTELKVL